jgi:hypothetical protein
MLGLPPSSLDLNANSEHLILPQASVRPQSQTVNAGPRIRPIQKRKLLVTLPCCKIKIL